MTARMASQGQRGNRVPWASAACQAILAIRGRLGSLPTPDAPAASTSPAIAIVRSTWSPATVPNGARSRTTRGNYRDQAAVLGAKGQRGKPGERGPPGQKGDPGPGILEVTLDDTSLVLIQADGSALCCDLLPLFERFR